MDNMTNVFTNNYEKMKLDRKVKVNRIRRHRKAENTKYAKVIITLLVILILSTIVAVSIAERYDTTHSYDTYVPNGYVVSYEHYQLESQDVDLDSVIIDHLVSHPETALYVPFQIEKEQVVKLNELDDNPDFSDYYETLVLPYIERIGDYQ